MDGCPDSSDSVCAPDRARVGRELDCDVWPLALFKSATVFSGYRSKCCPGVWTCI
jgi:hypothetical protein